MALPRTQESIGGECVLVDLMSMSRKGFQRAKDWHRSAELAFEDKRWSDVIYSSQMAVEIALKGILMSMGVSVPKIHDISFLFDQKMKNLDQEAFPVSILLDSATELAWLCSIRAEAGYGFEFSDEETDFADLAPRALKASNETILNTSIFLDKWEQFLKR